MQTWLTSLTIQSFHYSLIIIAVVSFLESLALVGLFIPGIVLMASLGTLIGNGYLNFYSAWLSGLVGCLFGDWISYYIGLYFKDWLHNLSLLKKNNIMLNKIKQSLYNHNIITILIGRFIGPTRPLVPLVCGMLKLPLKKFILPSTFGCLLWPPVYFFPGILTGTIIHIPSCKIDNTFKWCVTAVILLTWLSAWLSWRWWKRKKNNYIFSILSLKMINYLTILSIIISIFSIIALQFHPSMKVFRNILGTVFL